MDESLTERKRAEKAVAGSRTWLAVARAFALLCVFVWLDEILDLPHLLLGASHTPTNWHEAIGETILATIVGLFTVSRLVRSVTKRQQVEEALRESEARYRAVVEDQTELICRFVPDGTLTFVNEAYCRYFGKKQGELIGHSCMPLIPEEDREIARQQFASLSLEKPVGSYEHHVITPSGEIRWQQWTDRAIFDEQGHVVEFQSVGRDITEHKRVEETLKASEEYTRNIIDSSLNMIIAVDMDRHIVEFNKAAQETFGYRREEVIGEHVGMLYADPQESLLVYQTVIREGKCVQEVLDRRKSGEVFPAFLSASVVRDASGEIMGVMGVARDITEQVRAGEALRRSEAILQAVAFAADRLLRLSDLETGIPDVLASMGKATNVSRIYVFENHTDERGTLLTSQRYEWVAPGVTPQIDASELQNSSLIEGGFERWVETLSQAKALHGLVHELPQGEREALESQDIRSIAVMPIFVAGEWWGFIGFDECNTEREWSVAEIEALKMAADALGAAIQRQQAQEALRQRNRELAILNRAGQALVSTLDLDRILVTVLEEVRMLLDVVASSIWLTDPETDELVCQQVTGLQSDTVHGWQLAPREGIAGWVAHHGESLIVPDAWADERYFKGVDQQTGLPLRSILTVPLRVKQGVIGVLQVVDTEVDRFCPAELELLEPLAATATMAIENARLYEQARQDAETKSVLLREVNHRVKNNLSAIVGFLYAERRRAEAEDQAVYESITQALINRVQGLATVHSMLSASEWAPLRLSALAARVIRSSLRMLPHDKRISVDVTPSPTRVTPDQAHNLALVINELATNTVKHALQGRTTAHIAVRIELDGDTVLFEFRDDGPGYPEEILRLERYSVGFDLIKNIVRKSLRGELSLRNDQGTVATIQFEAKPQGCRTRIRNLHSEIRKWDERRTADGQPIPSP